MTGQPGGPQPSASPRQPMGQQAGQGAGMEVFSTFIRMEESARHAETVEELRHIMVNDLRRLFHFEQAALIIGDGRSESARLEAVSGVALVEAEAPFVAWMNRAARHLMAREDAGETHPVSSDMLPAREQAEWAEWLHPQTLWCPLKTKDGMVLGALLLTRNHPWPQAETVMLDRIADCYAYAWRALAGPRRRWRRPTARRWLLLAVLAVLVAALAAPIRQSALAPAEIVAIAPLAVSAPLDGVIARFKVRPNQPVIAGQVLFEFDDTNLRNQVAVSERALAVAQAELRQVTQGAMIDRKQAGQVALSENQVRLRQTELDYARALAARIAVTAERDGVAVFTDENEWIGRPVVTGQRILQIADPSHTELSVAVPVRDAIVLTPGAAIDLFLDVEPLVRRSATLASASYEAEMTPAGVLSYRVRADFPSDQPAPRIGLQGTAKIYGERVPLALYLFRRPLSTLRQTIGF
ncbi:efflux RND transporter periplasmic adaptor subunit [Azospirillum picis]|uniref:Membrane fusion protein biotin-lipoyl like domain-containing protein n=1 Tax=Azospirillum picis TaxID=488438 RepID=A0ABU0MRG1_9PROT|nr:HlyD family efflux transporter periplasmic adaptor subunit [Azospirillum picis]MBP2300818.1 hypothetical protein [Azospirillum picis]MDQ0536075.1 hypothetical protein [Azospirillum picis]